MSSLEQISSPTLKSQETSRLHLDVQRANWEDEEVPGGEGDLPRNVERWTICAMLEKWSPEEKNPLVLL